MIRITTSGPALLLLQQLTSRSTTRLLPLGLDADAAEITNILGIIPIAAGKGHHVLEEHVIDAAGQSYFVNPAGGPHLSAIEIDRLVALHLRQYREVTRLIEHGKIGRKRTGKKYKSRASLDYNRLLVLPAGAEYAFRQSLVEQSDAAEVILEPGMKTGTLSLRMVAPPIPTDPAD